MPCIVTSIIAGHKAEGESGKLHLIEVEVLHNSSRGSNENEVNTERFAFQHQMGAACNTSHLAFLVETSTKDRKVILSSAHAIEDPYIKICSSSLLNINNVEPINTISFN